MLKICLALVAFSIVLAGCGETAKVDEQTALKTDLKVGLVFDTGGRGDKSFNDSAYAGLDKASKEMGFKPDTIDSKDAKDYEANLSAMADRNCKIVFAVGISMKNAVEAIAPKYPNIKFAIIDASVMAPNVRSLLFKEEEGSFLVGYLAGLTTKTNKIGFVGGMKIPLIKKFEAGFFAGAKTANFNVQTLDSKYTGSWSDTTLGKVSADVLFGDGADIVFHASGLCGMGVISSAKEHNKFAIGVDSDQDGVAEGNVLTSMIKRVDTAVYQTILDVKNDKFTAGDMFFDLKTDGVGLSEMRFTKDKVPGDAMAKVEEMKKKIISGAVKVPTSDEELAAYLSTLTK